MTTTAIAAPARVSWAIDPLHSNVEFSVRHLMIATVKGRFADVRGTVVSETGDPDGTTIEVSIGTASIDTREAQRDAHLRSPDFFDADTFPAMTFTSRRVAGDMSTRFTVTGDLTIRGVTREVVLEVIPQGRITDPWGKERAGFEARTTIKRGEFGLTWNQALETGGVLVGDDVKVALDIELVAQ